MIAGSRGPVDYDESGSGPTVVLVPGSCSTGAAWRPVIGAWNGRFRCVTTSLLGYGGTAERRTASDVSISHETGMLEEVIQETGARRVHLVGHSYGGLVALAAAIGGNATIASLTMVETPAAELLRACGEHESYAVFRRMTQAYFAAFEAGNADAVATMIDFYGGPGTFAAWPERVRAYAVETTAVNIRDWASSFAFPLSPASLQSIDIPVLVLRGGASPPAVQRANALLSEHLRGALATISGAAHFVIATHAGEVATLIGRHVHGAEAVLTAASEI